MFSQIVQFRLLAATEVDHFEALIDEMIAWLRAQPGFAGYQLFRAGRDGIDLIHWHDEAGCRASLAAFIETRLAQVLMALCEPQCNSFFGACRRWNGGTSLLLRQD
ncbi:antibiotic biosynthesis monooxygenase [Chitinolyticbacter albus]|uniref:antibiotic biosynthesis monooxygenase n=1 Tax=Chitinolyticbacter albus TaxID=2961951 RepID=UPI00210E621A|nr:antibiotic biosynthesis monooxygenase [Chitinolyticbacter albus]